MICILNLKNVISKELGVQFQKSEKILFQLTL